MAGLWCLGFLVGCWGEWRFGRVTIRFEMIVGLRTEMRMAIPQQLLEILVCPICKTPVKLLADGSGLKCSACHRVYPVRDDIPVMLPEEAKIADSE
jgi:hypothetical protein